MKTIKCKLTVYFAEPFWIGIFERICDGKLSVAKVTFGAEPKDYDIQEFVLKHYYDLQFSPAVETIVKKDKKNPKRVLRDVKKQLKERKTKIKNGRQPEPSYIHLVPSVCRSFSIWAIYFSICALLHIS